MSSSVPIYWRKRIDNSRLVRRRDPEAAREAAGLVGGAVVCLAVLLLCAWQHFEFVHASYRLEELRGRHEQVLEWNRTLHLEQAVLLDPMRVDELARNQLGLDSPPAGQVIPLGGVSRPGPDGVLARSVGRDAALPARRVSFED
ncbi:MAG: hypothetical protein ACE5IP_10000 [Terriglobia bacterium]